MLSILQDVHLKNRGFARHNSIAFESQESSKKIKCDDQLQFSSNFQSGNLFAAIRRGQFSYDLILQNDYNTKGNTQWFYFQVGKMKQKQRYQFKIVNLIKKLSLFQDGFAPLIYSNTTEQYTRPNAKIYYARNQITRQGIFLLLGSYNNYYTTLSLTLENTFKQSVYISHCYPYTVTRLKSLIAQIPQQCIQQYQTNAGNPIYQLVIGNGALGVIIMARQHPGETPGSFVMQGLIKFLIEDNKVSRALKSKYKFLIFPMVNPDGVYYGNYRCNFYGFDLNRKWKKTHQQFQKQVYLIKQRIKQVCKKYPIKMFLDLHGHSKKYIRITRYKSFFYGNPSNNNLSKIYPFKCSLLNSNISYEESTFHISESKKNTARAYLFQRLGCQMSYTFQTSFMGYKDKSKIYYFTQQDYLNLGQTLLFGLYQLDNQCNSDLIVIGNMLDNIQHQQSKQVINDQSDSDAEVDLLTEDQIAGLYKKKTQIKKLNIPKKGIYKRQSLIYIKIKHQQTQTQLIIGNQLKRVQSAGLLVLPISVQSSKQFARPKRKQIVGMQSQSTQVGVKDLLYLPFSKKEFEQKKDTYVGYRNNCFLMMIDQFKHKVVSCRKKGKIDQKKSLQLQRSVQSMRKRRVNCFSNKLMPQFTMTSKGIRRQGNCYSNKRI